MLYVLDEIRGANAVLERSVSRARDELSELVSRVAFGGERVVLTRYGRPVAVLVPASEQDLDDAPADDEEAS